MKRPRIRIQAAALAFILLPAAAGVVAVRASATCQRFVRTYVTKPVRNRVSKVTADAWAQWRIAHPNWKPNPNVHRPKYMMSREESVNKVNFACSVEIIPSTLETLFEPTKIDLPPPIVDLPPMDATQISFPDEIPPEIAEVTPDNSWPPLAPFVPPILGGPPTPVGGTPLVPIIPPPVPPGGVVPEPSSLALAGTGFAFALAMLAERLRRAHSRESAA